MKLQHATILIKLLINSMATGHPDFNTEYKSKTNLNFFVKGTGSQNLTTTLFCPWTNPSQPDIDMLKGF